MLASSVSIALGWSPEYFLCSELLPALPSAWPYGSVKGLRARGDFEVDMQWRDGKLVSATIRSNAGGPCHLRYGNVTCTFDTKKGQEFFWDGQTEKMVPPRNDVDRVF